MKKQTGKGILWKLRKTLYTFMVYNLIIVCINFILVIALLSLGVISYVFFMVNEKQMKIKHDIERTR